MYVEFFGLSELPFNNTPDPRYFFSTPDHEEALASLIYAVSERKGFVLLTGEVGAGKTLVSRLMLRHFGARIAFASINHATKGAADLMESVLTELELPYDSDASNAHMVRILHDHLLTQFAQNTPVVLVMDEAQSLSVEAFEQLRMIGNLEADDAKLLQIAILGQPELQTMFRSPKLRQLRQRIFRCFHLPHLSRELTEGYIRHRLSVGGADEREIFTEGAIDRIHEHAEGLPRLINTICDNALLSAYSADRHLIDEEFIESTVKQMMTIGDASPIPQEQPAADVSPRGESAGELSHNRTRPARAAKPVPPPESPKPAAKSRGTAPSDVASRPVFTELDTFKRSTRKTLEEDARRIARVEQAIDEARDSWARTRNLRDELRSIAEQTRGLLAQAGKVTGELGQREEDVRKLHELFKNILGEAKIIAERVDDASAESRRSREGIKTTYDNLLAQSERTGRLTAVLRKVLDRAEQSVTTVVSTERIDSQTSAPASGLLSPDDKQSPLAQQAERFTRMLTSSRESLSDVRSLISATNKVRDDDDRSLSQTLETPPSPEKSTNRLAQQVQSLLDLIEPENLT